MKNKTDIEVEFFTKNGLLKYVHPSDRREAMDHVWYYVGNKNYNTQCNFRMTDELNIDRYILNDKQDDNCLCSLDIRFEVTSGRTIHFGFDHGN
jgi:hypothetical protein